MIAEELAWELSELQCLEGCLEQGFTLEMYVETKRNYVAYLKYQEDKLKSDTI